MTTDFIAQTEYRQHEDQLAAELERRRIDAEHAAAQFGGDRLALLAHRARARRAAHAAPGSATS